MEQEFDLRTYLNIVRRRYLYLLVPTVVVFALVCAVVYMLPQVYRASATILVESQQIPSELARSTVTSGAAERIQIIQQRLMTRENLLQIARKYDLFPSRRQRLSPSEIVDLMREAARIEEIDVGSKRTRRDTQAIAFTVSFEYWSPTLAARVANEFASLILEQNIQSRSGRAAETQKFFEQQVANLERALADQEARIVAFKQENKAALPDSLVFRRNSQVQLQGELAEIDRRIATLEGEREVWQQGSLATSATTDRNSPAAQLDQLRLQLVQLKGVYTDSHPEVKKVRKQISSLETAIRAAAPEDAEASGGAGAASSSPNAEESPIDSRRADQVALIDRQLEALRTRRATVEGMIAEVERSIQQTPQVEAALTALTREYEGRQLQYRDAQAKMAEAATGVRMEEDRQAERFEVIEQASAPAESAKPDRPRLILAGSFGSIAVGVGMVLLLELLDRSIRSGADLEKTLRIRPLSTIPYVATQGERASRRLRW
jgi:polysaccharide chain length determinant protein (PEP-CTERM system associated)